MTAAPGDIGFVHNTDWLDRVIQKMQERKYPPPAPESKKNHVFMVAGTDGSIIEAQSKGVVMNNLSAYNNVEYELWRPNYTPGNDMVAVHAMEELLGLKYGDGIIVCEALMFMTNTRWKFGRSGTEICSGAVAYALTRANIDCGPEETYDSPADLYHKLIEQKWVRTG